jgi:hypothetical protein
MIMRPGEFRVMTFVVAPSNQPPSVAVAPFDRVRRLPFQAAILVERLASFDVRRRLPFSAEHYPLGR